MRLAQIIIILSILLSTQVFSQKPVFFEAGTQWVDSVMKEMSIEEKVGQLIMVTSYPSQGEANEQKILNYIREYHIGGVLFLKNSPSQMAQSINRYQANSAIPLFMALDAENGLSFRLDSVVEYPYAMGLGALNSDSMIYRMGREVGQQCRALGINLNFAPVADVNSNPQNPIINYRSFGENPAKVAHKSWALAKGIQDEGIVVTAKHFPGHGDTKYDSHLTLPVIKRKYEQLNSVDFEPFRYAINQGINGIMSAHISLPLVDKTGLPGTLSPRVMTDFLRDSLKFEGLVFSDGMNMKGITNYFDEGEAAVKALLAGVDVIEFVLNPAKVSQNIIAAIQSGVLTMEAINNKCRKVLMSKKWAGIDSYTPVDVETLHKKINTGEYRLTSRYLHEKSLTVIENKNILIPLQQLDTLRIASVSIGAATETPFQKMLANYTSIDNFYIDTDESFSELDKLLKKLKSYNLVIVGVHGTHLPSRAYFGVKPMHAEAVSRIIKDKTSILTFFANPYSLKYYNGIEKAGSVILGYGSNELYQEYAAQLIFGGVGTDGKLPVSIAGKYNEGHGIVVKPSGRLKYTIPEEVGICSADLDDTVSLFARYGIQDTIFPGCQVLLAKEGKVFFHRPYGFFTYDSIVPLKKEHIYDWASLTKIIGPLPLIMKAVEDSLIDLDAPFSHYWPDFRNTDKASITFREVLAHQARLRSWIAFYLDVSLNDPKKKRMLIRSQPSGEFSVRLSNSLYINNHYKYRIYDMIKESKLLRKNDYMYSGLAFYLMPELLENITGVNYEEYLHNDFLKPLGATTVCYKPYRYFKIRDVVPTEIDLMFRKELVQGYVHDEGAAMMGGVSGHAGLFGNTNDLAKIMQFYLQKGNYGDFRFLEQSTVNKFTTIQYPKNENRRGLGFDKPYIDNASKKLEDAYPAIAVSDESFGHSGFTGTFAWADPENEMLFIFMSNRVYPSRTNTKLFSKNFRPELQQAIYNCQNTFRYTNY
ncbi:MAG: serine hydrolase [Prolixibacteraceae bacterium]|jgi:beta-N-acetylhexosaminidase|nr:serine hydrolase [Prolixibacteraceae bacterium]